MSDLRDRGSTRAWRRRRAQWQQLVDRGDAVCWRCGHPILPGQPWDLGHLTDRAAGGQDRDTAPEHRGCNRSAGARRLARVAESFEPKPW